MKSIYLLAITTLLLSACNISAGQPDVSSVSTAAAQTVEAALSPQPTAPIAAPFDTQIAAASATATASCTDNAAYTTWTRNTVTYDAKEVDKKLAPNTTFTMSWTLQNTGTCVWNSSYQMHFDSDTPLSPTAVFPILPSGEVVNPGGTVVVSLELTAPPQDGNYKSGYSLKNDRGESVINFGILTNVGTQSSPSSSLASPGNLKYAYDCTSGAVQVSLSWVDKANNEDGYRVYRDGNKG